ncbi:MAG: hypothetical protein LQ338_006671 [Usnochroma carphineum]|nr:MAG: hypothetical protein LQ338_006671 [Usnochroma carphineum]
MDRLPPRGSENRPASGVPVTVETRQFQDPFIFEISQLIRDRSDSGLVTGHAPIRTEGQVHIKVSDRPASEKSIWVETEIHSHDPSLVRVVSNEIGMTITTPSKVQLTNTQRSEEDSYVFIKITIYISRNLPLGGFRLETHSLPVNIPAGIPVSPRTAIHISAPSSPVYLSSPTSLSPFIVHALSTTLTTTSGSVHGDFHLSDSLSIHTTSGSIDINLALVRSQNNSTTPATLDIRSVSGSITVRTTNLVRPEPIPDRDYRSTISSSSGSITASLVHGTHTDLRSDNGRIQAGLYPHGNSTLRSDIYTRSLSGTTEIEVHPSLNNSSAPLRNFFADYNGISGSLRVAYPAQWEGKVEGSTVSGSIGIVWPGLKVVEDRRGYGSHRLRAVKGDGKGVLGFRAISGSVQLRGEEPLVSERPAEEGDGDAGTVAETETEVGSEGQTILTPQSEAGDEWMFVQ